MRFREKFYNFMQGRYGAINRDDRLNRFMMVLCFILLIVNIFVSNSILSIVIWVLIILYYARFFSRNISRRYDENAKYLRATERIRNWVNRRKEELLNRRGSSNGGGSYNSYSSGSRPKADREHRIFRCPGCSQKVRVPRGRGRICITCPKCGKEFVKRS